MLTIVSFVKSMRWSGQVFPYCWRVFTCSKGGNWQRKGIRGKCKAFSLKLINCYKCCRRGQWYQGKNFNFSNLKEGKDIGKQALTYVETRVEGRGGGGKGGQMPPWCPQNSQVIYSIRSYLHTQGKLAFLHVYCTCTVY